MPSSMAGFLSQVEGGSMFRRWTICLAAVASLRIAVAGDVKGCETVTVSAGFLAASGTYVAVGEYSGRKQYRGPNDAVLRYEHKAFGKITKNATAVAALGNTGADTWINASGWFVTQGNSYRYGLATPKPIFELKGVSGWVMKDAEAPVAVQCSDCISAPDWTNGVDCKSKGDSEAEGCKDDGTSCVGYVLKGWCSGGAKTALGETFMGAANKYPEQNCCACGGHWEPKMSDVLTQLDEEEKSITAFEGMIATMHSGIAEAEEALVNTTRLAQDARGKLSGLEKTTGTNFHLLENMTQTLAGLQATMSLENQGLVRGLNRSAELANATKVMAEDAKKVANETTLASLEVLNKRVWEASELEGKNSINVNEKRVKKAGEDENAFEGKLSKRIRGVLSKRLRNNVNGVRKQIRRLGACGEKKMAAGFLQPKLDAEAPSAHTGNLGTFQPCNELSEDYEEW